MRLSQKPPPPIELQAIKLREVYIRKKRMEEENVAVTERGLNIIRRQKQENDKEMEGQIETESEYRKRNELGDSVVLQ